MDGILVVFHLPEGTPRAMHNKFRRDMYGEDTSSWGGRYRYRRKGLLDDIPHVRLYWGVIIIRKSDYKKLRAIFKEYTPIVKKRIVKCLKSDMNELGKVDR